MTIRTGVWPYFWHDPVTRAALDGYAGALVRAANGDGVTAPDGTNFRTLWHTAVAAVGADRCDPWTYLYPDSHGALAANALFGSTGAWRCFQVDLEDAVPPAVIAEFCATLRALSPGTRLIFDSYPSRAQFIRVNGPAGAATWDTAMRLFDAFNPQVYYASQDHYDADRDGIPDWVDDALGKPVLPAISIEPTSSTDKRPESWPDVISSGAAADMLARHGTLALWRYPETNPWKTAFPITQGDDMSAADVIVINQHTDAIYNALAHGDNPDPVTGETHPFNLETILGIVRQIAVQVGAQADDQAQILAALATDTAKLQAAIDAVAPGSGISPARLADLLTHLHATTILTAQP